MTKSSNGPLYRHGHTGRTWATGSSPEYQSWHAMKARCLNPSDPSYARYGARGISVCERWKTFASFLADMGPRPSGTSIDRIDGARGYEPGNCRWATSREQAWNSSPVRWVVVGDQRTPLSVAARILGIDHRTLTRRVARGMTPQQAVDYPTNMNVSNARRRAWAAARKAGLTK